MQQINTSYCQNLPAEFPQAPLPQKQIFPWGFPQICGFFFISFSNSKMTKDSGPMTNNHRTCSSGQGHHAKKAPVLRHEWLHSKTVHFCCVNAMALPVLFSRGRSHITSLSSWTCSMAPGKKQVVNPITPVLQSSICLVPLRFHLKFMPFVLKHILPSTSLADAGHLLDSSF